MKNQRSWICADSVIMCGQCVKNQRSWICADSVILCGQCVKNQRSVPILHGQCVRSGRGHPQCMQMVNYLADRIPARTFIIHDGTARHQNSRCIRKVRSVRQRLDTPPPPSPRPPITVNISGTSSSPVCLEIHQDHNTTFTSLLLLLVYISGSDKNDRLVYPTNHHGIKTMLKKIK